MRSWQPVRQPVCTVDGQLQIYSTYRCLNIQYNSVVVLLLHLDGHLFICKIFAIEEGLIVLQHVS